MAQSAPESSDDQVPAQPTLRITGRTYSGNAEPLVDVLVMLYDWSIERHLRVRATVPLPPETTPDTHRS